MWVTCPSQSHSDVLGTEEWAKSEPWFNNCIISAEADQFTIPYQCLFLWPAQLFSDYVAFVFKTKVPSLLWGPRAVEEISTLIEGSTTCWACSGSWSQFNSVQSLSRVQLFVTPRAVACEAFLSITNSQSLLKLTSIELMMASNHLILCCPLLPLLSMFPSIRVFSNEAVLCIRWPKYWSFRFSISPSNEYAGLISFGMDWLDLLAVQGALKSLLQHHSSKASTPSCSAFFTVQLSHPYMTTGKTIALTRWTFVGKVMSLLFNMLSRLIITFLPRSRCLLISWL